MHWCLGFIIIIYIPTVLCDDILVGYYQDKPRVYYNSEKTKFEGIFGDLFDQIFQGSEYTLKYSKNVTLILPYLFYCIESYTDADYNDCLTNATCPVIFNYKEQIDVSQASNLSNALENYTKIQLSDEKFYVFYPNLLSKLVISVFWELFFVIVIVLLPWILINTTLYYIFENKSFRKMRFLTALFYATKNMLQISSRASKCGKIYSYIFYILTLIIMMLVLADFIFLISNMLMTHDVSSFKDATNRKSKICLLESDNIMVKMIKERKELVYVTGDEIQDCISQLNDIQTSSFFITQYYIENFFKINSEYNDEFRFSTSESAFESNNILIHNDYEELITQVSSNVKSLGADETIQKSISNYTTGPTFDRITPSSMFSESILFIFCSLTISSIFLICFVILLICGECKRAKHPRKQKPRPPKKEYAFRSVAQDTDGPKRENLVIYPRGYDPANRRQTFNAEEVVNRSNGNRKGKDQKNRTLSLSGPINTQKFQGKPEKSWLKIDAQSSKDDGSFKYQGTEDFENQVSSVSKAEFSAQSIHKEFFEDNQIKAHKTEDQNENINRRIEEVRASDAKFDRSFDRKE